MVGAPKGPPDYNAAPDVYDALEMFVEAETGTPCPVPQRAREELAGLPSDRGVGQIVKEFKTYFLARDYQALSRGIGSAGASQLLKWLQHMRVDTAERERLA